MFRGLLLVFVLTPSLVTAKELLFSPNVLRQVKQQATNSPASHLISADAKLHMRVFDPAKSEPKRPRSKSVDKEGGASFEKTERISQTWLSTMEHFLGIRINEYNFMQYLKKNSSCLSKFPTNFGSPSSDSEFKTLKNILVAQLGDYEYGDSSKDTYRTRKGYSDGELLGEQGREPRLIEAVGPPPVIFHYSPSCDEMITSGELRHASRDVYGPGRTITKHGLCMATVVGPRSSGLGTTTSAVSCVEGRRNQGWGRVARFLYLHRVRRHVRHQPRNQ